MAQFLIEEAVFERLEFEEIRARTNNLPGVETTEPASPHEAHGDRLRARLSELGAL